MSDEYEIELLQDSATTSLGDMNDTELRVQLTLRLSSATEVASVFEELRKNGKAFAYYVPVPVGAKTRIEIHRITKLSQW